MITPTPEGGYRVSCTELVCDRPLMRTVASTTHAENLERKHYREHHPDVQPTAPEPVVYDGPPLLLDLSAAAVAYLRNPHRAATAVWAALVGVDPRDVTKLTEVAEAARDAKNLLGYIPPL